MTVYSGSNIIMSGGIPVETPVITAEGREKTLAYSILRAHDKSDSPAIMKIGFDSLISHDITYVGIIQSARASGMTEFPIPYALTNCHNSLCAVGGTINEDDHAFGLSAAVKYGGIYIPANQAVIHQYARERLAVCGGMVLGSDSHTRYGCYGAMGVGEGGGELTKQLLRDTWDIEPPEVVLVWLEGTPRRGVGPHDVALALVGETFPEGRVKNRVLEFAGPGVAALSMDFRAGIDVMTTETSCLSSIWETDERVQEFYEMVGRADDYRELRIPDGAAYDAIVRIDLGAVESMIAMPFHPSRVYTIRELQSRADEILQEVEAECRELFGEVPFDRAALLRDGKLAAEQGVIVGCSGGMYENIAEAAVILEGEGIGGGYFDLSVYPPSAPVALALTRDGTAAKLMEAGAVMKPAFCGPCFGAGDTPANNTLSIRHATRNFPNREGSNPGDGQIALTALMDARSVAATARNGGVIMAATDLDYIVPEPSYRYDPVIYDQRVYDGWGNPKPDTELRLGPNITDWPVMPAPEENLLLRLCAVIHDDVTTTDELIPSGETSSYRSNPIRLSSYALSRRVPEYVPRSYEVKAFEDARRAGEELAPAARGAVDALGIDAKNTTIGSCIFARKPGDGSAREQAASCQKVVGGFANICYEFATKRYRSNCINWGIVPFTLEGNQEFSCEDGDWIYIEGLRSGILEERDTFKAKALRGDGSVEEMTLTCAGLTPEERRILLAGCLMNYYAEQAAAEN